MLHTLIEVTRKMQERKELSMRKVGPSVIAAIIVIIMTAVALVLTTVVNDVGLAVLVIFIGTYAIISSEKVNRTAMSLLGMALVGVVLWVG
ncbi:MAG: hypothetical protein ACXABV_19300, partial [Candidatus Thorarchaeota archaeon]